MMSARTCRGFTLIETLIYTALFVLIAGAIASFAATLQSSRVRTQVVLEVNGQGASVIRTITQAVRNASAINTPSVGVSGSTLSLTTLDPGTDPTVFSQTGDSLYVSEAGGADVALTNTKVAVSNLSFANRSRSGTPGVVEIRFTLSTAGSPTRPEEQYSVDFYGTAAIR